MELELRDGERLIPDDVVRMLDLAIPESIMAFLATMSHYVPFVFPSSQI